MYDKHQHVKEGFQATTHFTAPHTMQMMESESWALEDSLDWFYDYFEKNIVIKEKRLVRQQGKM